MKLADLPNDFTPDQFRQLDKESLDAVPFVRLRWLCQCKGCNNGTHVRDYGLEIWFFLDRNSKAAARNPRDYWMGRRNYWLCGKHNKFFKRLKKRFDFDHVWRRLIDPAKEVLVECDRKNMAIVKQIEKRNRQGLATC